MFVPTVYINRRNKLRHALDTGVVWLMGNNYVGMNYRSNPYPFRQDSTLLYYCGLELPNHHMLYDLDNEVCTIYGKPHGPESQLWSGPGMSFEQIQESTGVDQVKDITELKKDLQAHKHAGSQIHTLPAYRDEHILNQQEMLGAAAEPSERLIESVIAQRAKKEDREVIEIEEALKITALMHQTAKDHAQEGTTEYEILAAVQKVMIQNQGTFAYNPIISVRGEVLHNGTYGNTLKKGQFLLCDMGASNIMHFASDITRTFPVSGYMDGRMKNIYDIVLEAQKLAVSQCAPGVSFKEIHQNASKSLVEGLIQEGLMKGDPDHAVEKGAHALFFPHGLGHMIGLDVHDMENLGENYVGYGKKEKRSDQFGTSALRLARELEEDYVVTVEPGLYFIPMLIEMWKSENKHADFINYDKLESYYDFGGIRIEDNVRITENGHEVLGPGIEK